MNAPRLGVVLLCVLTATALGAVTNFVLNLGDDFEGEIKDPRDADVYTFSAVAGTEVSFRVKASHDKTLKPKLQLIDLTDKSKLAEVSSNDKKAEIDDLRLPHTGHYELWVGSNQGTTGHYEGDSRGEIDDKLLKHKDTVTVAPRGLLEIGFDADAGWELDAKIEPKHGWGNASGAFMTNAALEGPSGPVSLTGFLEENGPDVEIDDLVLPELGSYVLSALNTGLTGLVKWKIELDPDSDGHGGDDDDDHGDDDDDDDHGGGGGDGDDDDDHHGGGGGHGDDDDQHDGHGNGHGNGQDDDDGDDHGGNDRHGSDH